MSGEETRPIVANQETGEVEVGTPRRALEQPGRYATPILWGIIVAAFALVMVAAALTLMIEFLAPSAIESKKVEAAVILLLFSTPAAFLSGLVIPSPFQRR